MYKPTVGSLVLYKIRPARIKAQDDKITIELEGGKEKRVRDKDISVLHPGPLASFNELQPLDGDVEENWELLEGSTTDLKELSELVYGDFSPSSAWAAWQLLDDGLYFEGEIHEIRPRDAEAVNETREERLSKARQELEWATLLDRIRRNDILPEDHKPLGEVEAVALGQRSGSRIMDALNIQQTPEHAHRLLVRTGYWRANKNPYPRRLGVTLDKPKAQVPPMQDLPRVDLTDLAAYAIDDENNQDPDDAVSIRDGRIWVHVADVASLVTADSDMDLEARQRGANLYLPEGVVPMLPDAVTEQLGLGLQQESPALSISFVLTEQGEVTEIRIELTRLRVQRLSYAEANLSLNESPFDELYAKSQIYRQRRLAAGASRIELPEAKIQVRNDEVTIKQLPAYESREMVTDLMLMAGEAVAIYCQQHDIPAPFASQAPPDQPSSPVGMAEMYAYRRQFKPTQVKTTVEPHAGLGLAAYTRATSPLRRYSDLLVHQQLHAHLAGQPTLDLNALGERLSLSEMGSMGVRKAERLSNQHWRMIYLRDHPDWQGDAVVLNIEGDRLTLMLTELAMDIKMRTKKAVELNQVIRVKSREVDVPELTCYFRQVD